MIYLDNAATSFYKPQEVKDAIAKYLTSPGNPGRGVNKASVDAGEIVYEARCKVAKFFGTDDYTKCVWTSGATEGLNTLIRGLLTKKDHVITTYLEHNSTLRPLYRCGCELSILDKIDLQNIKKMHKKNTKALFLNHASNVTGEIQEIDQIGKYCHENGILFIVDSAQSAGVVDIDVKKSNIDFLVFAGHKGLLGIQGIGGIIINSPAHIEPLKVGGNGVNSFDKNHPTFYPDCLEAGTLNTPGIVSLNASVDFLQKYGINKIYEHETLLRNEFMAYLESRSDVEIYHSPTLKSCGIVSFNIKGKDAAIVCDILNQNNIAVRSGAMCAPLALSHYSATSCLRISFGLGNTKSDVEALIKVLSCS